MECINEKLRAQIEEQAQTPKRSYLPRPRRPQRSRSGPRQRSWANMSHELKTPMKAVIGFSSHLLDDSLTTEQKEYIEGIRKGSEALLATIDDILNFSGTEKNNVDCLQPFIMMLPYYILITCVQATFGNMYVTDIQGVLSKFKIPPQP